MATAHLLAILVAAVPGLAGWLEDARAVVPNVDVTAPAELVQAPVPGLREAALPAPTRAVPRARRTVQPVVSFAEPQAPALDHALPRRAVWRSPSPPQGPPAA
jgi:hypothetical protein